jgi:hypothetical protein
VSNDKQDRMKRRSESESEGEYGERARTRRGRSKKQEEESGEELGATAMQWGNGLRQQVVCFRLNKSWEIQAPRTEMICETLTIRLAKVRRAMYRRITFVRREPILDTWASCWVQGSLFDGCLPGGFVRAKKSEEVGITQSRRRQLDGKREQRRCRRLELDGFGRALFEEGSCG